MPTTIEKFGDIEAFSGKSWDTWVERLHLFYVENSITDSLQQGTLLLTLCGAETYETAKVFASSQTAGVVYYAELVAGFDAPFDPNSPQVYARCYFQQHNHLPG